MDAVTTKILQFLNTINIPVEFVEFPAEKEFLPGISISNASLLVNSKQLKYPGDLLHEAGHIAVASPLKRAGLDGRLENTTDEAIGEEMMAIAWSYAAAKHIGISSDIVFHADGYKGQGSKIAEDFAMGRYVGVSMLQWVGLTYEPKNAAEKNTSPYPHMIKWIRE